MRPACRPLIVTAVLCGLASTCLAEVTTLRLGNPAVAAPARADRPDGKPPRGYVAFTRTAPAMDGKGADPAWGSAQAMRPDWTLDGSAPAGAATEVRLLRDDKALYVLARCAEPFTGKLRAGNRGHDGSLWDDDSVEMFIGTDDDWDYYHFIVNSVGATYDGFNKDTKWNGGFKAAAAVGKNEWTATWAIPLEKIQFGGKVPAQWIANFTRNRHTRGRTEESAWSPTFSGDSHLPRRFGTLLFQDPPQEVLDAQKPPALPQGVSILASGEGEGVVRFDLSALPGGAKVLRADLVLCRTGALTGKDDEAMVSPEVYPLAGAFKEGEAPKVEGKPLDLRPPWFDGFDATEAVRAQVAAGAGGGFFVKAFPLWNAAASCLDVTYDAGSTGVSPVPPKTTGGTPALPPTGGTPVPPVPPQATGLKVFHRSGQTFITWNEIEDLVGSDDVRWAQLRQVLGSMDGRREVRYCVYRSAKPITAATLAQAERIATVRPLSCWNVNGRCIERPIDEAMSRYALIHGQWNPFVNASVDGEYGLNCRMDRFVIEDVELPKGPTPAPAASRWLPRGAGLYVHTVAEKGKAHYAVVTRIDGRQNTADFSAANATADPVEETPAAPAPVFQGLLPPRPYWNYPEARYHYVQWTAPPMGNLPCQYFNWTVAVPTSLGSTGVSPVGAGSTGVPPVTGKPTDTGGTPVLPVPLELSLPREGRSYYWTQYRVRRDSIVLTPHDFPVFSMWYGHHEALGTLKPFRGGAVHNYTERRILAFIEWAEGRWPVDKGKVIVTGMSEGAASGADRLARRHPQVFTGGAVLRGPAHRDAAAVVRGGRRDGRLAGLADQMERIWGKLEWDLQADTGQPVWTELGR